MARFPVKWLIGGEGPWVEELEKVRAHLWVVLGRREKAGKWLAGVEQISGEEELGSGDVPARKKG